MLLKTRYWALEVLGVLVAFFLIVAISLAYALSRGPVSLNAINSFIGVVVTSSFQLDDIELEALQLIYDESRGGLIVEGQQVLVKDGETTYKIDQFTASISSKAFFKSFLLVPETLTAENITAIIPAEKTAHPNGYANIGPEAVEGFNPSSALNDARQGLSETASLKAFDYIQELSFPSIIFVFEEIDSQRVWRTNDSYAVFWRDQEGLHIDFNIELNAEKQTSQVEFKLDQPPNQNGQAQLKIKNVRPSVLGSIFPEIPLLLVADMPLDGLMNFTTDADGNFAQAEAKMQLSGGQLKLKDGALPIKNATARAQMNFIDREVEIEEIDFSIGPHRGLFSGTFAYDIDAQGVASHLEGKMSAKQLSLELGKGDIFNPDKLNIEFDLDLNKELLALSQVVFETGGGVFQIGGEFGYTNPDLPFHLTGFVKDLPIEGLKKIWPSKLSPRTKKWFDENVSLGTISTGQVNMKTSVADIRKQRKGIALADEVVDIKLDIENSRLRYIKNMPEMENLFGQLHLRGDSFDAVIDKAIIPINQDKIINITQSRYVEPDIHIRGNNVDIQLLMDGDISAIFDLFSFPQIGFRQESFTGDNRLSGEGRVGITVSLPVSRTVSPEERRAKMQVVLDATVTNFSVIGGVQGYDVRSPLVSLAYQQDRLALESQILVNGVAFDVSINEAYEQFKRRRTEASLSAILDEYDFANLGLDAVAKRVRGTMPVRLDIDRDREGNLDLTLFSTTTESALRLSPLGYEKPTNIAGEVLAYAAVNSDGDFENVNLIMKQDALTVLKAYAHFTQGRLASLNIPEMNLSPQGSVSLLLNRDQQARKLSIKGSYFDMSGFFKNTDFGLPIFDDINPEFQSVLVDEQVDEAPQTKSSFIDRASDLLQDDALIEIEIDKLAANHNIMVSDFRAQLSGRDGLMRKADMSGRFQDESEILFSLYQAEQNMRRYVLRVMRAENLFKALNVSSTMKDGTLLVSGQLEGVGTGRGTAYLYDFTIQDLPPLAQLLTLGSLKGISDTIQNEGLYVENAELTFRHEKQLLDIESFLAKGPALGVTLQGVADFENEQVFLNGSLIPSYRINSLLGRIPLIGYLFSGGEGGGLLGISYKVSGPMSEPEVTVNPLSFFAPGFIRNIFKLNIFGPAKPVLEMAPSK